MRPNPQRGQRKLHELAGRSGSETGPAPHAEPHAARLPRARNGERGCDRGGRQSGYSILRPGAGLLSKAVFRNRHGDPVRVGKANSSGGGQHARVTVAPIPRNGSGTNNRRSCAPDHNVGEPADMDAAGPTEDANFGSCQIQAHRAGYAASPLKRGNRNRTVMRSSQPASPASLTEGAGFGFSSTRTSQISSLQRVKVKVDKKSDDLSVVTATS